MRSIVAGVETGAAMISIDEVVLLFHRISVSHREDTNEDLKACANVTASDKCLVLDLQDEHGFDIEQVLKLTACECKRYSPSRCCLSMI